MLILHDFTSIYFKWRKKDDFSGLNVTSWFAMFY